MHMDIASMVLAVRAGCAPRCAQSARLSVFNLHGNHGLAWSCSVEDYRALLACCGLRPGSYPSSIEQKKMLACCG